MTDDMVNHLIEFCSNPNNPPFGQWISSIFELVDSQNENFSMNEKRDLFLWLLRGLIDKGVIVVFLPEELYMNGVPSVPVREAIRNFHDQSTSFIEIWDVTGADVVEYIRRKWPEGIANPDDEELNIFWYGNYCPRIGWYDPQTKSVIAS